MKLYLRFGHISMQIDFARPGKPTDNAHVETFNGSFRDGRLNVHWLNTIEEAKMLIETWRRDDNESRPHMALGNIPPREYALQARVSSSSTGSRRPKANIASGPPFPSASAMARWLPPNGFTGKVHHTDAKVGGTYKMSFASFTTGTRISFGGEFRELLPNERLRYTDSFDDQNLSGDIQVTVTLKKVSVGTEVNIVQQGLPMSFRWNLAISAGKNLSKVWRDSSSPRCQANDTPPYCHSAVIQTHRFLPHLRSLRSRR